MSMTKLCCSGLGRWAAVLGLAAGLFLTGCKSHSPQRQPPDAAGATVGAAGSPPGTVDPQLFHPGDAVTVVFTDLPGLVAPLEVKIKEDGTVTLLHNQEFTFANKTRGVVEKEIRARYVPDFYKNMTVVIKWEPQTLFYYLDGEVKAPARQTYIERTTVLKAIASAGGFTDFAKKKAVKLTRLDGRKFTVNCVKAREIPSLDLEIYPGDKIYVPRKLF
jgi:polysaccharide biosynthesis/export protein VpsN